MNVTTFDSTKNHLLDILKNIADGKIQLPDFQRGWVWDDEHIKGLLASVSLSYPIGAVMLLQTGNNDIRFKPRLVEGVHSINGKQPEALILDGQQRLTSLFQSLFSDRVVTTRNDRKQPIRRWYYVDINKAVDEDVDREDSIVSLREDRIIPNFRGEPEFDYSTPDAEYKACLFPLNKLANYSEWRRNFSKYWNYDQEKAQLFDEFETRIIKRIEQYQIPIIALHSTTPKDAVCQVFEKVNTGGVALTVFELLTATFAVDDFDLRNDYVERRNVLHRHPVLKSIDSTIFLQAITLLATYHRHRAGGKAVSCKRSDILNLSLGDYQTFADQATDGFQKAARLLHSQKIFSDKDLPYRTQLAPFGAIMGFLGDKADLDGVKNKITRWYWCGVLGQLYGSSVETRFAKDLPEVVAWINGDSEPSTISDANFAPDRLYTLRTRNSAAYKGVSALIIRDGGHDFRTGSEISDQIYYDESIDIHHIFPKNWCIKAGIEPRQYDSIVNKTPISGKTNRMIGDKAPSLYLREITEKWDAQRSMERMEEILRTHLIEPRTMYNDRFAEFFEARRKTILTRVEQAMGKQLLQEMSAMEAEEIAQFVELPESESGR